MIASLIDREDNFEIVRNEVAAIIAMESVSQQALAVAAGKAPALWALAVYIERSNPWEMWLNDNADRTPVVNVWFDTDTFPGQRGNVISRQQADGVINIDCYGLGVSADNPSGGHLPGDRQAALTAQRALRLCRSIIMAGEYAYLNLRGIVGGRWPRSRTVFQPMQGDKPVQNVVGARMPLQVSYNEFAPQVVGEELETIFVTLERAEDDRLLAELQYDF